MFLGTFVKKVLLD